MELKCDHNCHALYNLKYHLVLVTKYRHPVITEPVFATIRDQFLRVAEMNNVAVEEIAYESDYVHVLLSIPPQVRITTFINSLKSTSSRRVRKEHADALKPYYWKDVFWNRSYLILTSGGAPIEVIREYIREQGTPEHAKRKKKAAITT